MIRDWIAVKLLWLAMTVSGPAVTRLIVKAFRDMGWRQMKPAPPNGQRIH